MNRFATILLGATIGCGAIAAHASINAIDVPRISNGSTDFVGVTAFAMRGDAMPIAATSAMPAHVQATSAARMPATSQEAMATVGPDLPLRPGPATDPMQHRLWGTPD